jgi:hypothetical protein
VVQALYGKRFVPLGDYLHILISVGGKGIVFLSITLINSHFNRLFNVFNKYLPLSM